MDKLKPWNPYKPIEMTPKAFELYVFDWLKNQGHELTDFKVEHQVNLEGFGGEYEFDAIVKFTVFGGASFTVLVECKHYNRPVEREKILSFYSKINDVKAHKGMVFSTSGYQSGALEFASKYNIATLSLFDETFLYETRSKSDFDIAKEETGIYVLQLLQSTSENIISKVRMEQTKNIQIFEWLMV